MRSINRMLLTCVVGVSMVTKISHAGHPPPWVDHSTKRTIPTVGFFPNTFPRDPVEVNLYLEHLLMGQILEPLVESASAGNISPAVAERWTISADARTIRFTLRDGLKFSNGADVTANDVKYSLERHLSSNSQSKAFLQKVKAIRILGPKSVEIELFNPYVAIFKALSRDQLGIVPNHWAFDPKAQEPFIGTGPYRAVKNGDGWRLQLNAFYHDKSAVHIPEWSVVLFDPKAPQYDQIPVPDLMPFLEPEVVRTLEQRPGNPVQQYLHSRVNHFQQLSAWWYPDGANASNRDLQMRAMAALRALLENRRERLGLRKATGVIPEGISGYLLEAPAPVPSSAFTQSPLVTVKVAVQKKHLTMIDSSADLAEVEQKYRMRFQFVEYVVTKIGQVKEIRPDAVISAFAGGFQDPEGFLVVLSAILSTDLPTLFARDYQKYLQASSETDWGVRARLYQELGAALITNNVMAPGWKFEIVSLMQPTLVHNASTMSYTPKLKEYRYKGDLSGDEGR